VSLQAIVLSLISDIDDPAVRMDISSTIYFLRDVYLDGKLGEEELRKELREIVNTVLSATHPELLPEERKKRVDDLVNQLMRAIKLSTLRIRALSRFRSRYRPEFE